MSKLGIKLFAIILIISLSGLLLVTIFVNLNINRQFKNYIYSENEENIAKIASILEENYLKNGNWKNIENIIANYTGTRNIKFYIVDKQNNIITYSHPGIIKGQNIDRDKIKSMALKTDGEKIGYLYWYNPEKQNMYTEHAQHFTEQVNKFIFFTAGIIALITIIISFILSRKLTKPLIKMNKVAGRVANGDFNQNLQIDGNDEIAELAVAFNNMISKLKHLEKIRQESTSDLAHELRTPVTTIKSYIEGIEDGILTPDKKTLEEIHEEIERLIKLIKRLQELTEAEEKIINLKKKKQNLSDILKNIIDRYKVKAHKKEIKIKTNYSPNNIFITGDKESLQTIFSNLFSNALKYTPQKGKIKITIKDREQKTIIKIQDTGIGIPENELPFIFERFYRTDKSRSTGSGGTGIGLTITKKLVEAHNGTIKATSNNRGTKFTLSFPLY